MNNTEQQIEYAKVRQSKRGNDNRDQNRRYLAGKLSGLIIAAAAAYFLYLLLWPFSYTHLDDIVVSVDPIKVGSYQRYTARTCQNPGTEGSVLRNIVIAGTDEAPISSTSVPARPILCSNIIMIPENLPNGKYEVTFHITFKTNAVRDALNPIVRDYRSAPFVVEGGPAIEIPNRLIEELRDNRNRREADKGSSSSEPSSRTQTQPEEKSPQNTPETTPGVLPQPSLPSTPATDPRRKPLIDAQIRLNPSAPVEILLPRVHDALQGGTITALLNRVQPTHKEKEIKPWQTYQPQRSYKSQPTQITTQ